MRRGRAQEGAVARYRYLSEESMPTTPNFVTHMLGLLDRIMTTLDDDEDHFQAPFAEYVSAWLGCVGVCVWGGIGGWGLGSLLGWLARPVLFAGLCLNVPPMYWHPGGFRSI